MCASGKRIHKFYWCDDYADCEDNHADELDCECLTALPVSWDALWRVFILGVFQ